MGSIPTTPKSDGGVEWDVAITDRHLLNFGKIILEKIKIILVESIIPATFAYEREG